MGGFVALALDTVVFAVAASTVPFELLATAVGECTKNSVD